MAHSKGRHILQRNGVHETNGIRTSWVTVGGRSNLSVSTVPIANAACRGLATMNPTLQALYGWRGRQGKPAINGSPSQSASDVHLPYSVESVRSTSELWPCAWQYPSH